MILAWTGRLEEASDEMASLQRRCLERGEETEVVAALFYVVIAEVWRGRFADAAEAAQDAMERALQLGGDQPLMWSLSVRATVYAYTGRIDEARRDVAAALAVSQRSGSLLLRMALTTLGFLEASLSNYDAALAALEPLIYMVHAAPDATEIFVGAFIADAVEAFVALGRLDEAEPLIAALERNGRRLDRAWMLAIGARCRAMLLAAQGDLERRQSGCAAGDDRTRSATDAFERARTQLLVGQLHRRNRQKDAASQALREALAAFETMGTPLWAERARAELGRVDVGPRQTPG